MGCVFSCPGGPTPERFGQRSPETHELNLFAPVARNCTAWYTPSHKRSQQFSADKEGVSMKFDYGPFTVQRRVDFKEEGMFFKDRIEFTEDVDLEEFRFFNLPVPLDYYEVEVKSDDELLIRRDEKALAVRVNGIEAPLKLTDKLLTPKGRVQTACKCQQSFMAGRGECVEVEFSVRMNGDAE
jgi:hypothetical protein